MMMMVAMEGSRKALTAAASLASSFSKPKMPPAGSGGCMPKAVVVGGIIVPPKLPIDY